MTKKDSDIAFNLISRQKINGLTSEEKLNFIIKEVKNGKILVLEQGLTPVEQAGLIERTMKEIEQDTFIGVEMEGYGEDTPTFLQKLFGMAKRPRMTLIGPANLLKMIKKDSDMIQTKIISGSGAK
ncbi:MAG: DUF2073 domain-containing protein [Candidatus Thermoplasmatota archaeon]|nr:DUF2073 domain-containing protein [Candidatus Thermoplasmatota archaeon]